MGDQRLFYDPPEDIGLNFKSNLLSINLRKHRFIFHPTPKVAKRVGLVVGEINTIFADTIKWPRDQCFIHPNSPVCTAKNRPGAIRKSFSWRDADGSHKVTVNIGVLILRQLDRITDEQMEGYINSSWHLSHLCGNWTCCNWRHFCIEDGRQNSSRNACLKRPGPTGRPCKHYPRCMPDMKLALLPSQYVRDRILNAVQELASLDNPDPLESCLIKSVSDCAYLTESCSVCKCEHRAVYLCRVLDSLPQSMLLQGALDSDTMPSECLENAKVSLQSIIGNLLQRTHD